MLATVATTSFKISGKIYGLLKDLRVLLNATSHSRESDDATSVSSIKNEMFLAMMLLLRHAHSLTYVACVGDSITKGGHESSNTRKCGARPCNNFPWRGARILV